MNLRPRISSHLHHAYVLFACNAQINGLRARYLRQIFGIAIEGHRRARKSSSSTSSSRIKKSVGSRVAAESLRFGGEYGRARIYALACPLARITSHMQRVHTHALRENPASSRGLYACIYDMRARDCPELVQILSSLAHRGSHASRWRSCKLNICRPVSVRECRKKS